jgi:hypothetical protein
MLDTTWTVMPQYVTSILVAVSRNTAIALAFAFGPAKTVDQYNCFLLLSPGMVSTSQPSFLNRTKDLHLPYLPKPIISHSSSVFTTFSTRFVRVLVAGVLQMPSGHAQSLSATGFYLN